MDNRELKPDRAQPIGRLRIELTHLRTAVLASLLTLALVFLVNTFRDSSGIPAVKANQAEFPEAPYKNSYEFAEDWFTWHIPVWTEILTPYRGQPDLHYLEVGLYEGASAVWMLENILTHPTARLTGLDIFHGPVKERFFSNIEKSGEAEKVSVIIGLSQEELRRLPLDSFDIIYIDGSHLAPDVLEDAVLSWRLLRDGGILIFDDYRWVGGEAEGREPMMKPQLGIESFYRFFGTHFEVLHNDYQLILRKTSRHQADPQWDWQP